MPNRRTMLTALAASGLTLTGRRTLAQQAEPAADLVAGARKEGGLTLYTSIAQQDLPAFVTPFKAKYGFEPTIWRASGDKVLQRVLAENAAGRYDVDCIHISAPELEIMHREGVLQAIDWPNTADLGPGAVQPHKEWIGTLLSVWVQSYNTNLVEQADLPVHYQDLLDPKWQGKLGIEAENIDWVATVIDILGGEPGVQFFRDLVTKNGVSVRNGHSLLDNLVIAGEVPMALTMYNYMPVQAMKDGAPIAWTAIQPVVARANGVAVARHAKRPDAARLFGEFMLNEGQDILVKLDYVPTRKSTGSPFAALQMAIVDPVKSIDAREERDRMFRQLFMS